MYFTLTMEKAEPAQNDVTTNYSSIFKGLLPAVGGPAFWIDELEQQDAIRQRQVMSSEAAKRRQEEEVLTQSVELKGCSWCQTSEFTICFGLLRWWMDNISSKWWEMCLHDQFIPTGDVLS